MISVSGFFLTKLEINPVGGEIQWEQKRISYESDVFIRSPLRLRAEHVLQNDEEDLIVGPT